MTHQELETTMKEMLENEIREENTRRETTALGGPSEHELLILRTVAKVFADLDGAQGRVFRQIDQVLTKLVGQVQQLENQVAMLRGQLLFRK